MKSNIIKTISILIVLLISYFRFIYSKPDFKYEIISLDNGYGYSISHNGKVIIYQPFIPCIGSKTAFKSKEDAKKIANIICKKLENNNSPTITNKEIQQLLGKLH